MSIQARSGGETGGTPRFARDGRPGVWAQSAHVDGMPGNRAARRSGSDPRIPSPSRMNDYALGGKDNYAADRAAIDGIREVLPGISAAARANRDFGHRAARWMAGRGIRQFIDLGCGFPAYLSTHQAVHQISPAARVLYA